MEKAVIVREFSLKSYVTYLRQTLLPNNFG